MQRDFDLVRNILLQVEALPPGSWVQHIEASEGTTPQIIAEHAALMSEHGLLAANVSSVTEGCYSVGPLTWQGHDFISVARSDTVWKAAEDKLISKGIDVSLEVLKALLIQMSKLALNLPP